MCMFLQVMKMMGLSNFVHWLAWFITTFIQFSVTMIVLTVMLKYGRVLFYSDPLIVFITLELFAIATISFWWVFTSTRVFYLDRPLTWRKYFPQNKLLRFLLPSKFCLGPHLLSVKKALLQEVSICLMYSLLYITASKQFHVTYSFTFLVHKDLF